MAAIDSLRHKWDNITPRERGLVLLLGVCAPLVFLLWMGLAISDKLDEKADNNDKMRRALETLQGYRLRGGPSQGPTGPEIPKEPVKLESYLDKAAQKVTITVQGGYKRRNPETKPNGFVMDSVEFQVTGVTMEQATQFLETIETDNKLVVITQLQMKHSFSDPEHKKLDMKLMVSTFSQPQAAGAGSGSASGTASASGAP
jgi:hypothetical protein